MTEILESISRTDLILASGAGIFLLVARSAWRALRARMKVAAELKDALRSTYPEELDPLEAADVLTAARSRGGNVDVFDFDTNLTHNLAISVELIEKVRKGAYHVITDNTGALSLTPRFTYEDGEPNLEEIPFEEAESAPDATPVDVVPPGHGERSEIRFHHCSGSFWQAFEELKERLGKPRIMNAMEWAELVMSGESNDKLLNTWIGECVVFLPNGDALIVDRAHNPIFSRSHRGWKDVLIMRSDHDLNKLVRRASPNPGRAVLRGALLLNREQWDRDLAEQSMELDANRLMKHPVPNFLFRDALRYFADYMDQHNLKFCLSLRTNLGDLDFVLAPTTVSAAFIGDPHVVQARVEPLCVSLKRGQVGGGIFLGSGWTPQNLHGYTVGGEDRHSG